VEGGKKEVIGERWENRKNIGKGRGGQLAYFLSSKYKILKRQFLSG